jgi:hypothetical protein
LFNVAGREHSLVLVFDDLRANPMAVYRKALEFLGVEDDGQELFEIRYGSSIYRYRWLQQLFFVPAVRNGKLVDSVHRRRRKYNADGSKRRDLLKRITDWNKVPATPAPLTQKMRATVIDELRTDIQLLSRLLDRDLGFWLTG